MIVDEHLGIQGNGNQDTQSWFHSMEVNIMIDSYDVCRDWLEQLRRNQSKLLMQLNSQVTANTFEQTHTFTVKHRKRTVYGETRTAVKSRALLAKTLANFRGSRASSALFNVSEVQGNSNCACVGK